MNLTLVKRFRNEIIILFASVFLVSAFFYKLSADSFVADKKSQVESSIVEISKIAALKNMWGAKKIAKEAKKLKTLVSSSKLKSYKKTSGKVKVNYKELNIRELNTVTKKVMNTPFQISKFIVNENVKDSYSLELVCKW